MDERNLLQASIDELDREKGVRLRCYDGWIAKGALSVTDAKDRMERLQRAISYLRKLQDNQGGENGVENRMDDHPATTPGP